jgi:hypothetical protein
VSSEMVFDVLPLFLSGVLGVRTAAIGLIERSSPISCGTQASSRAPTASITPSSAP